MTIDHKAVILFFSGHTGEILQAGMLDHYIAPDETHSDTEIEAIMKDPTGVGKTLLSDLDKHRMGYSYGPGISHICFYMALCCVINKTETCKPLLDSLAKACYISVDNYASLEVKYEKPKEIKYIY